MFWRNLDRRVCDHLAAAGDEVVLIAPFIKASALERLLAAIPPGVPLRVFTRWRVDEVVAGVSDLEAFDLVEAWPGAALHLCDELHAKVYLVDGQTALVGSANITAAGLGLSTRPNFEVLQAVTVSRGTAALFIADLDARSRLATRQEAETIRALAEALRAKLPLEAPAPPDAQGQIQLATNRFWFPIFRSPDRLFGLSQDGDWMAHATSNEPAFRDLIALSPPLDAGERVFDAHVRVALTNAPVVRALEALLAEPQRFGSITDWLRGVLPDATHEERQSACQTLIRWVTYFASDRFEVDVPGAYSEVLRLRLPG